MAKDIDAFSGALGLNWAVVNACARAPGSASGRKIRQAVQCSESERGDCPSSNNTKPRLFSANFTGGRLSDLPSAYTAWGLAARDPPARRPRVRRAGGVRVGRRIT